MRVGVVREIKAAESRVALVPSGALALTRLGHEVVVERGAGAASGFTDEDYAHTGATIVDAKGAWSSDIVLKVKEPLAQEYSYLGQQCLFTFLHLAANADLAAALVAAGTTALAYDTRAMSRARCHCSLP